MDQETPLYGGGKGITILPDKSIIKGDSANTKILSFKNHSGTHIDFPNHFFEYGKTSELYSAQNWVFDKPFLIEKSIALNEIICLTKDEINKIPIDTNFLIVKTGFGDFRKDEKYWKYNPGFSPLLASMLRERLPNLRVLGMDFISLTSFQNREIGREAHRNFLGGNNPILLVEDMDLTNLNDNPFSIFCLPLMVNGLDGAPVSIIASIKK